MPRAQQGAGQTPLKPLHVTLRGQLHDQLVTRLERNEAGEGAGRELAIFSGGIKEASLEKVTLKKDLKGMRG